MTTTYSFPKFAEECEAAGLIGIRRNDTHWQIAREGTGKLVCDIWPTADKWRPQLPGIKPNTRRGSPGHAVAWIKGVLPQPVRERIQLDAKPIPVKVFRGALCDGSRRDGLRLRRACDYLNKRQKDYPVIFTPEDLAAALSAEPSAEEYRDAIIGLLDLIEDLAPGGRETPAETRARELLYETGHWTDPPAVGDTVKAEELPEEETPEEERERLLKERKAAARKAEEGTFNNEL